MTPLGPPLLTMRDVAKSFAAVRALDGVSLDAHAGEVHAILGENGAGKSTLMKVLSGAHQPDFGVMTLDGRPFAPRDPRDAQSLGIAMIYQELAIAPHLSVTANILLGRESTRGNILLRHRDHRRRAADALAQLGHHDLPLDAPAGSLPLAAQQLIEVARALVSDARVLVLDEPTAVLGEKDTAQLFAVIERLRERGLAILYISHFLEEVQRVAQSYTVLRDGRTVATGRMNQTTTPELIAAMIGRPLGEMFPSVPHQPAEPILTLHALSGENLPRRVDLSLRRGEILGIAGLVGAGRTEFLRTLFGLDPQRAGRVERDGRPAGPPTPRGRIDAGFGFLSEDRKTEGLALRRGLDDNLTLSSLPRYARLGWLNLRARRAATAAWIDRLKIRATDPSQPVQMLSGGNQQKVALGRLLEQDAEILLLDEPTRGVDVGSKVEIYRLIGELAARGKAVIMVSSYLPELLGVCDRIAVMRRGVLSEPKPTSAWTEHSLLTAATGV